MPATPLGFSVGLAPGQYAQLDDVVVTRRELPGQLTAAQRELYARLGLPAAAFGNVRVFAPPRRGDPAGTPDVSARDRAVSLFYWTLAEFCAEELLPFVFADSEDERAQYTMLIGQVAARLRRDAVPAGEEGAIRVRGVDSGNDKIIRM